MTSGAAALTEQERARLIAAMGHGDWCDGCGGPQWINERGEHECMVLELVVESILAARLADSRPVVSEAAVEAARKVLFENDDDRNDGSRFYYEQTARAALTAALPLLGDGRGEA